MLSCLRFDDAEGNCFRAILDGGALLKITNPSSFKQDPADDGSVGSVGSMPELHQPEEPSSSNVTSGITPAAFESLHLHGLTLLGWCIRLGNIPAFELCLAQGIDPTKPADGSRGNTPLHLVAK